jgi:tetratricopeptide (TPR) repeat protein
LILLALAGLAACLCTPYHYRTLAWPTPLGINPAEQAWMRDPLGQDLVVYSFGKRFVSSSIFSSPCAWAYYLLLAVGAASFLLTAKKLRLGRLLAWLALAALSVYQARAIPFFAVAGAALTALNLQEVILHRPRTEVLLRFATTARGMGIMTGLALAVLAWPGWLQPAPYRPRGWDVEPDETMVRMAKRLQQERAKSHFRLDRFALTFTPETAHYLAWFCPSEKGFVDSRWSLFPRAAKDFVRMRNCLLQDSASAQRELVDLLEANHLDRIILYDPDRERTALAYRRLFLDSENWRLSAIEGGAALFIHSTSESTPIAAVFDPRWVAYHPTDDQLAPTSSRPLSPPSWLDPFRLRGDERSADREEAALHVLSFDLQTELGAQQWVLTQVTGLTGSGLGFNPAEAAVTLTLRLDFGLPPSPREPLLLAVRAARRALFAHPDDAQAFQLLGEAYLRLGRHTRESMWQLMLPRLAALRQVQTLTALEQAVSLRPDLDNGHAILAQLYYESDQWDNVLHHLQARLRIADSLVKRGGTAGAAGGERRSALRADVVKMEELVEQAQKVYKANTEEISDPSKVLNRASLAARHRLTRQALELLLASYPAIFGAVGVEMQLNLMLKAGRAYEVRDWLTPQVENLIGFSIFHWVEAQAAAACGDYADADLEMHRLSEVLQNVPFMPGRVVPARSSVALRVGGAFLAHPVPIEGIAGYATALEFQSEAFRPLEPIADLLRQEADWLVLRGLLTLEWGDVKTARSRFRTALDLWVSEEEAAAGGGVDFTSRPIAQRILSAIDDSEKNKEGR